MCKAESGEDACNVGVVGEVKVEGLVERKRDGIIVKCDVVLSSGACYSVVRQAGEEFFNIADTDRRPVGDSK